MTANAPYTPIDCGLVDELQLRAMRRTPADLLFQQDGSEFAVRAVIVDVSTRGGAEWAILEDGREIRLDELLSVDGIQFRRSC